MCPQYTVTRQADDADVVSQILAAELGTEANLMSFFQYQLLQFHIAESALETVLALMIPAIIPFNVLKAGINGVITFFLYKSISHLMKGN